MRILIAGGMIAGTMVPGVASAIDWNITGFLREEIAVSVTDQPQPETYYRAAPYKAQYIPGFGGLDANLRPVGDPNSSSGAFSYQQNGLPGGFGGCGPGGVLCDTNGNGLNDQAAAHIGDNPFNMFNTRAELEIQARFNDHISAYARIRAYFDGTAAFSQEGTQMEKHFLTDTGWGDNRGNILELQNNQTMIDLPSFYADLNYGKWWFRVGQQQIAWGEALFFRVFDVANGLDLRRHLFLDVAGEEYADERVASPAIRGSYTFANGWEVDAFVQMFSPTLYPNTNTPYNVIADGFTLQNGKIGKGFKDAENSLNYGARMIMPDLFAKGLTVSLMAVNRYNPDGVVTWDDAGSFQNHDTSAGFPGGNVPGGFTANPFCAGPNSLLGNPTPMADGSCGHPFMLDGAGTMSYQDWWTLAQRARLDPVQGAATSIAESPGSAQLAPLYGIGMMSDGRYDFVQEAGVKTQTVNGVTSLTNFLAFDQNAIAACTATKSCHRLTGEARKLLGMQTVSGFFTGFGPLRGMIRREYKREWIAGVGFNYIVEAEPGTWLDQLIVRGEMSYTPDKEFTDISLSKHFVKRDEILASVILEKYQSIFEAIPATYLVFEWMHRDQTDLGGRLLDGYSGGPDLLYESTGGSPEGVSSADYLTFAFQQPFPNLIWRLDFAMLADVRGGIFFQPGVRYKPRGNLQFDLYANIAENVGGDSNNDMLSTFDAFDEVFVRMSYYF